MTKKKRKENTKINNIGICSTFENVENIYIHIRYDIYNIDIDYLYEIYDIIMHGHGYIYIDDHDILSIQSLYNISQEWLIMKKSQV
jgi:hypothetical protein